MKDFIEQRIIEAVRGLLTGRVNELLGNSQYAIPLIEFGDYCGGTVIVPDVALASCERTEKERIVRLDAYSVTITFSLPETPESELYCYAYSGAVCKALSENPTLNGVADRAVVTGKRYLSPEKKNCGEGWGVVITTHILFEDVTNAC